MSKKTKAIAFSILVPILAVGILFMFFGRASQKTNGFTRKFIGPEISLITVLPFDSCQLLDVSKNSLFYKNYSNNSIGILNITDPNDRRSFIRFNGKKVHNSVFGNFMNGYFYLFDPQEHTISIFDKDGKLSASKKVDYLFTRGIGVTDSSIVIRAGDENGMNRFLRKLNLFTGHRIDEDCQNIRLEDAGLLSDGLLNFDETSGKVTYTYFYGNGILTYDKGLANKKIIRTIDTITAYTGGIIKRKGSVTHDAPPKPVSIYSTVSGGRVYVQSGLKADNEPGEGFNKNSVVDIYNLNTSEYEGSFYIPKRDGIRASRFRINGNWLTAQYKNQILIYRLELPTFERGEPFPSITD